MPNPILGDLGGNALQGTAGPDTILGDAIALGVLQQGGNDTILAGAGNDTVFGDAVTLSGATGGDDSINGGPGDDRIFADGDVLASAPDPATPFPNARVNAVGGNDMVHGGAGNDTIWGDGGATPPGVLYGNDTLLGGAGNDLVFGDFETGSTFVHPVAADLIRGGAGQRDHHRSGAGRTVRAASGLWRRRHGVPGRRGEVGARRHPVRVAVGAISGRLEQAARNCLSTCEGAPAMAAGRPRRAMRAPLPRLTQAHHE